MLVPVCAACEGTKGQGVTLCHSENVSHAESDSLVKSLD